MKKWGPGFALVVLFCLPIFFIRANGPALLKDTDTAVLLAKISERNAPLSWFVTDWPLENHFYRPVSTLFFELDLRLWGATNPAGYGLTNALLVIGCIFALFWFVRELTDNLSLSTGAACLFALWCFAPPVWLGSPLLWLGLATTLWCGFARKQWVPALIAGGLWILFGAELAGIEELRSRMIDWIPGRTASVMALFGLLGLAAYCRFERISAVRLPLPAPGPLDPPATKNTQVRDVAPKSAWIWAALSMLCISLSLASYEQAVTVPFALLGAAIVMRFEGLRVRWALSFASIALLLGYLVLRGIIVPSQASGYQQQQFRSGPGLWVSIWEFAFPAANSITATRITFSEVGWMSIILGSFWSGIVALWSNLAAVIRLPQSKIALFGYVASLGTFLPMAFLKFFGHYYFLPMAFRAIFVAALVGLAGQATVSAARRPERQAPPRLHPAPGSLPRP